MILTLMFIALLIYQWWLNRQARKASKKAHDAQVKAIGMAFAEQRRQFEENRPC